MTQDITLAEVREALAKQEVELTVVGKRCVYLNNRRIVGGKPYVSENIPQHSFTLPIQRLFDAIPDLAKLDAMPDRIAEMKAENARLRELLKDLRDDLNHNAQVHLADPYILGELRSLCERVGYGNVMNSVSALWRDALGNMPGGEFVSGSCRATVVNRVKRIDAALKGAVKP